MQALVRSLVLIALSCSTVAAAQLVQETSQNNQNTANNQLSVSFASTTQGDLIVVYVTPGTNQPGTISVSDSSNNTYVAASSTLTTGISGCATSQEFFYASNITGGADTITATTSASSGMGLIVLEYSGLATTGALDAQAGTSGGCPWSANPSSATLTTTDPNDLVVAAASLAASENWTAGSGYTLRPALIPYFAAEDQVISASGSYTPAFTLSGSANWLAASLAFRVAGSGVPTCGLQDDGSTSYPPQNYVDFVPPAKMSSYTDQTFGCTVVRLTDGENDFGTSTGHNYIKSAFNADDSKFLAYEIDYGNFYVIDPSTGTVIVPPGQLEFAGSSADEMWDRTNPNVIYYELYNSNVLKKADVSACTLANPCDGAHGTSVVTSVVHTFSEYTSLDNNNNKRDISDDGCYVAMGGYYTVNGVGYADTFAYNLCTDTKSAVAQTCAASTIVNFTAGMTHLDQMWVAWAPNTNPPTGNCYGIWLYDSNMNVEGQLFTGTPHLAAVYDPVANKQYVLFEASGSGTNACNNGTTSGIGEVEIDQPAPFPVTCFVSFPYHIGDVHISSNNATGWFVAEIGDESGAAPCPSGASCTANDNSSLPSDWSSNWGHLFNEIIAGNISTGQIYRLANSRSRLTGTSPCGGYWAEPRLSLDFSGAYIAFDSSMARTNPPLPACTQDYVDTYIIKFR